MFLWVGSCARMPGGMGEWGLKSSLCAIHRALSSMGLHSPTKGYIFLSYTMYHMGRKQPQERDERGRILQQSLQG